MTSGEKIKLMCEGKILLGILSLILYSKDKVFRSLASRTGEFSYDPARRLSRNRPDPHYPEKVEAAHARISAQIILLIRRKHKRYASVSCKMV